MHHQEDIPINTFQLMALLNEAQQQDYIYLLNHGVFCTTCGDICRNGVRVTEIHLNALNDIMIKGSCKACNGRVARIMEFGEDKPFYEKAERFRMTIQN